MHRPPRPAFKSTQAFPIQLRKIFTPDFFYHDSELKPQEPILRSLRANQEQKHNYQSCNESQNIECGELGQKNNQPTNSAPRSNNFHGKSFKIRNYTHTRVKENTVPIKQSNRKITVTREHKQTQKKSIISKQPDPQLPINKVIIGLRSYPKNLELTFLSCKFASIPLIQNDNPTETRTENCSMELNGDDIGAQKSKNQFPDWMLVVHQSLFSTLNESTSNKIREGLKFLKENHPFVKVVFRADKEGDAKNFLNIWIKNKTPIDYVIYGKQKHAQRVQAYDLSELKNISKIRRFIILSDILDPSEYYYYCSTEDSTHASKKVDWTQKFTYLRINGFQAFLKFCEKAVINEIDDEIYAQELLIKQETEKYMMLEEAFNKIEIHRTRQRFKKRSRSERRSSSIKQMNRDINGINESTSIQQKNEEFRRKMIQYVKIIQQDNRSQKKLKKQQSQNHINFFDKAGSLKLIEQKNEGTINCKTPYQVIYQLIKNNGLIFKQIYKFQTEAGSADFLQNL